MHAKQIFYQFNYNPFYKNTGRIEELESLGKQLKNKCGVGGTAKDNEIILQGNHKEKVIKLLIELGYSGTKGTGGG